MRTRTRVSWLWSFLGVILSASAPAVTWYVDGSVSVPGDGTSWEAAFHTIQEGIDEASEADTVIVAEGIYTENIHFDSKNIVLTSTDPSDPAMVETTIIDGNATGSVVVFTGTEDETCVLTGFTIRNGDAWLGGGICGGTGTDGTHATIRDNIITRNFADMGAGLFACHGTIANNTITDNASGRGGGGLCECSRRIEGNTVSRNTTYRYGGGLRDCDGLIVNNIISENSARGNETSSKGGGLYGCNGQIENNKILGNNATGSGGGLSDCHGEIVANVISDNNAANGGGLWCADGSVCRNTITNNHAELSGGGLCLCRGEVEGNTISGNTAKLGGGLSSSRAVGNVIEGNRAWEEGGGLYACSKRVVNNTISGNSAARGGALAHCGSSLWDYAASQNLTSSTAPPPKFGPIKGNEIVGNHAWEDGGGLYTCICMIEDNLIQGNWAAGNGGGLAFCEETIQENTVRGNSATDGGGLYGCQGLIERNLIIENSAFGTYPSRGLGGGLCSCTGTLRNSIVAGNLANVRGGGICEWGGAIHNVSAVANSAGLSGGGLENCEGTIINSILWGNSAAEGPQIWNCAEPVYCCIQDCNDGKGGLPVSTNTPDDPQFLDPNGEDGDASTANDNDYHLRMNSPCLDRGDNSAVDPAGADLDGNLRIAFGRSGLTVDLGAYEHNSSPFVITQVVLSGSGVQFIWNSLPAVTYLVRSTENPKNLSWSALAEIPSQGAFTWWTDPDTAAARKFYRIEVK